MIAITGAAGFIGSNLAHRLAANGSLLLLVDHPLTADKFQNWIGLPKFIFYEHQAFLDLLADRPPPIEMIFHLGACSKTTETNWDYLQKNNIEYSQRLWQWCSERGSPLIYASSAATYGNGNKGFFDQTPPQQLKPLNLYARSKNDFDAWALEQVAEQKPTPPYWAGMKFFNVFGPRERHKAGQSSVVWKAYQEILATGSLKLFKSNDSMITDGGQRRDFVFVEDCIDHVLWLSQFQAAKGLYNSGTGIARTFLDLAHAVFAALGRQPNIEFVEMPQSLSQHYQNYTQAITYTLESTGYTKPVTSLEDGVQQTIRWIEQEQT